jgi:hypothetical protein
MSASLHMTEADMRASRSNIHGEIWASDQQLMLASGGRADGATLRTLADPPEIVAIMRRMMTEAEDVGRQIDATAGPPPWDRGSTVVGGVVM